MTELYLTILFFHFVSDAHTISLFVDHMLHLLGLAFTPISYTIVRGELLLYNLMMVDNKFDVFVLVVKMIVISCIIRFFDHEAL